MNPAIAIVGMACRFPDAANPGELWENALAQRRAFRRIPSTRLNAADYFSPDPRAPDRTYILTAALIEDYEFDRVRYRVPADAYRAADLTHWLALDIAAQALSDAGFPGGEGLPRQSTGVFLGNTLTGEFSRAAALRTRWPYVRRILSSVLGEQDWHAIEKAYKSPFPEMNQETLAGSLSNTIAGRISNYFDLKGGGYTVDGACASSLLAAATACSALAAGDCDAALAGGVDLSLDPFELVGFAKVGALAAERMRIYDANSAGFWPGEGCGFAVLQRLEDAQAQGRSIYAVIRGWGISSDGSGGLTRPEADGQLLALQRAYRRAGFGPDSIGYFEGHGTGTAVGDATELRVLSRARREAGGKAPATISSIKANIGHTKAAAGIAGLINAAMAVRAQVRPPATGCETPHPEMSAELCALPAPDLWPDSLPVRAAVSAMGFGGINTHVVLEAAGARRRHALSDAELQLARTPRDAELFLFSSGDQFQAAAGIAADLSLAEMTDFAASLASGPAGPLREAVVASTPAELAGKLATIFQPKPHPGRVPRIGFLFPGQGSQNSAAATDIAQPSIVRDSIAALRQLAELGIQAEVAIGHSLGEIAALSWGGVLDEETAVRIASVRGRLMAALKGPRGAMAAISASEEETRACISGEPVVMAGLNSSCQTVVSGEAEAVARAAASARAAGMHAVLLPVSHAFHSPLVAGAAEPFFKYLTLESFAAPSGRIVSTVTGRELTTSDDIRALLRRQIASPVLFQRALESAGEMDLWIEVGPGSVLSDLAAQTVSSPIVSTQSGSPSIRPFLEAVAAAWEAGAPICSEALFAGRFVRPFRGRRSFFVNPCELVPPNSLEKVAHNGLAGRGHFSQVSHSFDAAPGGLCAPVEVANVPAAESEPPPVANSAASVLEVVREVIAQRVDLPRDSFSADARLLADLHLNSIAVAQIAAQAARRLNLPPPAAPLEYAHLTVREVATALEAVRTAPSIEEPLVPPGVDAWVRAFETRLVAKLLPPARPEAIVGEWSLFGEPVGEPIGEQGFQSANLPGGGGVLLHLPPHPDERCADVMLDAARAAMRLRPPSRFVLVQHGGGGAALARTLHLENRGLPVCVVDVPEADPLMAARVAAEAAATRGYSESHYDEQGVRRVPLLSVLAETPGQSAFPRGVLVVTGGGKGIGAECAIEAASMGSSSLAIIGTSPESENPALERMRALGIPAVYFPADVTDASAVRSVFEQVRRELGPITNILHCAGINHPQRLEALTEDQFRRTVAVKVSGLANLLAAAEPDPLELIVAFGSIIARIGMPGETDYALANEWMSRELGRWAASHPACRCLTLEWSVWEGAGMGERLAHLDFLRRAGVSPISIEEGLAAFRRIVSSRVRGPVIVSGRFGAPPTVSFDAPELPLLRFLDRPRVHYPGVELVSEAELSTANDPYLEDHVFSGARLFPGVLALEAAAQAAMAVAGRNQPPAFERIQFARPIVVPPEGSLTIRIAALARAPDTIEVCLRSAETGFQTDHFRALCRFGAPAPIPALRMALDPAAPPLDPARDLYGSLLFQQGRFRRVLGYRRLRAAECIAEIACASARDWFSRYLPQTLVLGDPGMRDAAIHAIQACIPHACVLPVGVAAIALRPHAPPAMYTVQSRERHRDPNWFLYDVEISTPEDGIVEQWDSLELRVVNPAPLPAAWPAALLAPYLERRIAETAAPCNIAIAWGRNAAEAAPIRRTDGKPLPSNGSHISRSHSGDLTLMVSSALPTGCDCEPVVVRSPEVWRDLLGPEGFALAALVAREARESLDDAATRVWSALECARKAGLRQGLPIALAPTDGLPSEDPGWVMLRAGTAPIATWIAPVRELAAPVVFAILTDMRVGACA